MAMVYEALTAERIMQGLSREKVDEIAPESTLFLPGFAGPIRDQLAEQSARQVTVGPVCAAELPIFFGKSHWELA
jgi:CO dehydrogenase/acetyl-CoA synthase gamma subunit (corrinoid Fe-S protein)